MSAARCATALRRCSPARIRRSKAVVLPSPPTPLPEYRERGEISPPLSRSTGRVGKSVLPSPGTPGEGPGVRAELHHLTLNLCCAAYLFSLYFLHPRGLGIESFTRICHKRRCPRMGNVLCGDRQSSM